MGFMDELKKNVDKATDAVADNADKVNGGIDKAARVVDEKTGGKHTDKITKAAGKAKGLVDKAEEQSTKKKGGPRP